MSGKATKYLKLQIFCLLVLDKTFIFARPIIQKMATYQKRGFKPKNKVEEEQQVIEQSTTAEVFNTLDTSASKTEQWVARNQTYILAVIGVVVIGLLGYLGFQRFIMEPKAAEADREIFFPMQYFSLAQQDETYADSLFTLALNGAEGKYGLLDIIDEYSGTPAANLAEYAAGIAYLHLDQYQEAITHLEAYKSEDAILGAIGIGAIGDAFMELGQTDEALGYYEKAIGHDTNGYTTPLYLQKAGVASLSLGDYEDAEEFFTRIKEEFPDSPQATGVDAYIGLAQQGK
jgi:tetratricopeptide (TPR) repeat protein